MSYENISKISVDVILENIQTFLFFFILSNIKLIYLICILFYFIEICFKINSHFDFPHFLNEKFFSVSGTQSFYLKHTDDIICLDVNQHPKFKNVIATGQIGNTPSVHVWDGATKETLSIVQGGHSKGICSVDFSCTGKNIVTVGLEDEHNVIVWRWQDGEILSYAEHFKKDQLGKGSLSTFSFASAAPLLASIGCIFLFIEWEKMLLSHQLFNKEQRLI